MKNRTALIEELKQDTEAFTAFRLFAQLRLAMSLPEAKAILGFPPEASPSPEEVKNAWKEKIFESHPDRGGDPTMAVKLNVARDVLEQKGTHAPRETPPESKPSEPPAAKPYEGDTFEQAWAKAGASGLDLKIYSSFHGSNSNNGYVFIGQDGNGWCALGVSYRPRGFSLKMREFESDNWFAAKQCFPVQALGPKTFLGIEKLITSIVPSLKDSYFLDKWGVVPDGWKPSGLKSFEKLPRATLKLPQAMLGAGILSAETSGGRGKNLVKTKISLRGKFDKVKEQQIRVHSPEKKYSVVDGYHMFLSINGKDFELSDATLDALNAKSFFSLLYNFTRDKIETPKNLTQLRGGFMSGGADFMLNLLLESLRGEPAEVKAGIERAISELPQPKKKTAELLEALKLFTRGM